MIDPGFVLILKSSGIGESEPDLAGTLMSGFLNTLFDSQRLPSKLICLNSGVFLTTEGSSLAETLKKYVETGTEVVSCSTCLNYYGRAEKLVVGGAGTMKDTVGAILDANKVLAL
jgi:selenium metabolism protein YedF